MMPGTPGASYDAEQLMISGAVRFVTESVSSARADNEVASKARAEAIRLGWEHVARKDLAARLKPVSVADVLIFGADGARLVRYQEGAKTASFRFHPSTAPLRIKNLARGGTDVMAAAMGLGSGDEVLDCTMGLGADAIVAAFIAGPNGRVQALEASEEVFAAVDIGMRDYDGDYLIKEATGRISRLMSDYRQALRGYEDGSFDVVYMDPMFLTRVSSATPIDAIRPWACGEYPSWEDILHAARVSRRRFVMKVRKGERASLPYDMGRIMVFHSSHAGPVEYIGIEKGRMQQ